MTRRRLADDGPPAPLAAPPRPRATTPDAGRLTARGLRTRARLVSAARAEFERNGYLETTVHDIARRAQVAYGTFYTYFSSKDEVFEEVVHALIEDMSRLPARPPAEGLTPAQRIGRANRAYLDAYQRNAGMMGVLEQVATFSPRLRDVRRAARRRWVERSRRAIEVWQAEGRVSSSIDAYYAASALGSMVDRSAYVWLVLGEPFDLDAAAAQLTSLYCNALGLAPPPEPLGA